MNSSSRTVYVNISTSKKTLTKKANKKKAKSAKELKQQPDSMNFVTNSLCKNISTGKTWAQVVAAPLARGADQQGLYRQPTEVPSCRPQQKTVVVELKKTRKKKNKKARRRV